MQNDSNGSKNALWEFIKLPFKIAIAIVEFAWALLGF